MRARDPDNLLLHIVCACDSDPAQVLRFEIFGLHHLEPDCRSTECVREGLIHRRQVLDTLVYPTMIESMRFASSDEYAGLLESSYGNEKCPTHFIEVWEKNRTPSPRTGILFQCMHQCELFQRVSLCTQHSLLLMASLRWLPKHCLGCFVGQGAFRCVQCANPHNIRDPAR